VVNTDTFDEALYAELCEGSTVWSRSRQRQKPGTAAAEHELLGRDGSRSRSAPSPHWKPPLTSVGVPTEPSWRCSPLPRTPNARWCRTVAAAGCRPPRLATPDPTE